MKKIISILLGICLCGGVFAQTQLKIISFNIHAGYDAPIADIAAFIKEQDPDIVALQEVEYYTNRTRRIRKKVDQSATIHQYE